MVRSCREVACDFIGLIIAALGNYAITQVITINLFLVLRFVQGVGCGVSYVIGRTIAGDLMRREKLAAIGSFLTLFLSLSPAVVPLLGGNVQHWFNWEANFILLGTFILVVLLLIFFLLDETNVNPTQEKFSLSLVCKNYYSFKSSSLFVGCTLLAGLAMTVYYVYIALSPFIFQNDFHVTVRMCGWLMVVTSLGGIISKLISPWIIVRYK